jgi:hypothetical protein
MLISTALLLDSLIRNSVCTPAKLPCCRVEVGYEIREEQKNDCLLKFFVEITQSESQLLFICVDAKVS